MDYSNKTREELIALCKEKKIKGYSGKKKDEIVKLLSTDKDTSITNVITEVLPEKIYRLNYIGSKSRLKDFIIPECPINPDYWIEPFGGMMSFYFELDNPQKEIARLPYPLFKPEYVWELKGEVNIDSGFTILKNEAVEKIYNNNIFSTLKDKILNSNEIVFDNLKLEFVLKNNIININTLIANSSMMGFTAKGKINLNEDSIVLKGLIVPGYALNKLFGIGQVPILGKIIVGEEGGGIFAVRYDYVKSRSDKKGDFSINPASALIPGGIRNIFDLF
jgi:hypothetical protein